MKLDEFKKTWRVFIRLDVTRRDLTRLFETWRDSSRLTSFDESRQDKPSRAKPGRAEQSEDRATNLQKTYLSESKWSKTCILAKISYRSFLPITILGKNDVIKYFYTRAEPSQDEPSRAEPRRAEPSLTDFV